MNPPRIHQEYRIIPPDIISTMPIQKPRVDSGCTWRADCISGRIQFRMGRIQPGVASSEIPCIVLLHMPMPLILSSKLMLNFACIIIRRMGLPSCFSWYYCRGGWHMGLTCLRR
ncbi:hypothetical protein M758_6G118100 [Ceratodon purpureus]|nr:hypothetical protein M758_6G118100 [Ceratodon purpureus]